MNTEEVMRERAMLIGWKFSHGLTAEETARLDWLNAEALRLCPTVTPEMTAALEAIRTRLDSRQARRKTPNASLEGRGAGLPAERPSRSDCSASAPGKGD